MKKKIIISICIVILVIAGFLGKKEIERAREAHENSHVEFADKIMGQALCNAQWWRDDLTLENVTYKELKKITELNIGYIGYYDTIMDLQYCTDLTKIMINYVSGEQDGAYFVNQGEVNRKVTKEEIENVQQELSEILPKLKKIKWVTLTDFGDVQWTSIDYMKNCDQIELFEIDNCAATDYSVLKTCTSLKDIAIEHSDISKAEDLIGLEHIESIEIYDTPLAENPEEIKKLKEAYPEAYIYYDKELEK